MQTAEYEGLLRGLFGWMPGMGREFELYGGVDVEYLLLFELIENVFAMDCSIDVEAHELGVETHVACVLTTEPPAKRPYDSFYLEYF